MRKSIIFFSNNMKIGGVEKALVNLLNSIDSDKYEVTLILEEAVGELLDKLSSNINIKEYKLSKCTIAILRKAINFVKRMAWALRNKNKYLFSCSYCTYSVIGSRLAKYASENSCIYIHSDYAMVFKDKEELIKYFDMLGLTEFRHILFVSNESRNNLIKVYPQVTNKSCVINNIVDNKCINELALESVELDLGCKTTFVFVGRLEEESKRITRLINAFEKALVERPKIKLIIVGDGKDRKLYETMVEERHLNSSIQFMGSQINPYKYMNIADCVILTSDYEGYPVIFYEALMLGKNIITTVSVSDEYVDISDFATVVEKDSDAVAKAIVDFRPKREFNNKIIDIEKLNKKRLDSLYNIFNAK